MKSIIVVALICGVGACPFPDGLVGNWTTATIGTLVITKTTLQTTSTAYLSTAQKYECMFNYTFNNETSYVLKSTTSKVIVSGIPALFFWMCIEFHESHADAYYHYINTQFSSGVVIMRLSFQLPGADVKGYNVCTTARALEEFEPMIREGTALNGSSACPEPLIGKNYFDYITTSGTKDCSTNYTGYLESCFDQNKTRLDVVTNTSCTANPFSTTGKQLNCLFTIPIGNETSDKYITMLYNMDKGAASPFFCMFLDGLDNSTRSKASVAPGTCVLGQNASVVPTSGFRLELYTNGTLPVPDVKRDTVWLIVLIVLCGVLIISIVVVCCLHYHCKLAEKRKAREKKILITDDHPLGEMSISLDAPPGMDRAVDNPYLEIGRDTYQPPIRKKKNRDVLNPIAESSMILDFKHRSWPSRGIDTLENTDPFTEMDNGMLDNGAVVPISPAGSKAVSRKSQGQKSFTFGEITPYGEIKSPIRPYMNGDVKKPYPAIMDRAMSPETAMEVRTLKSEKSFHSVRAKSEHGKSVRAPSVRAPSVRAPSVRAPSVKALSVRAPSEKGPGDKGPSFASVKRSKTPGSHVRRVKTPGVRSSKVGTAVPRLQRAATSTKIGSITTRRGSAPPSPRKKMTRSNTMTVDTRTYDSNNEGMANFLEGETNWGATSDAGKSQRSARTNRTSNTAKSNATSRASPRKSILKKTSQRMSLADILTDDEKDNRETGDLSAYQFPLAKSSLQDQYEAMLRRNDPMANVKKVKKAHRNPWH